MSKSEKLFNKVMTIITCVFLGWFLLGNIILNSEVFAGDTTMFTDPGCAVDSYYTGQDSCGSSNPVLTGITMSSTVNNMAMVVCPDCFYANNEQAMKNNSYALRLEGGILGKVTNSMMATLVSFPSDIRPNVYVMNELSPTRVNQTYADGMGLNTIMPVLELWKYMRNIAYYGFVLVIVIISFMIMFRQKIGGQVAITVVNAIPRVIVGMILVQFSFLLAGIILSISYFVMAVIGTMLLTVGRSMGITSSTSFPAGLGGPLHLFTSAIWYVNGAVSTENPLEGIFGSAKSDGTLGTWIIQHFPNVSTVWKAIFTQIDTLSLGTLVVRFVFVIGMLYASFKIFFNLLKAYAQIFIKVIVLPIVVLMGSLPGQEKMIINAYKGILADSFVFPITFAMINIAILIAVSSINNPITFPQGINTTIFDSGSGNLGGFIAYAVFVATTTADAILKDLFKVEESKTGQLITQAIMQNSQKTPMVGSLLK